MKASSYSKNDLRDSFDKFFTMFVPYNALYNEAARRLMSRGEISAKELFDKTSATSHVTRYVGEHRLASVIKLDAISHVNEITRLIRIGKFYIHLKGRTFLPDHEEDRKHLDRIETGTEQEFCESLLLLMYKTRCNLFHGNKEYLATQKLILNPMTETLRIVVNELLCSLERDSVDARNVGRRLTKDTNDLVESSELLPAIYRC